MDPAFGVKEMKHLKSKKMVFLGYFLVTRLCGNYTSH